MLSYLVPIVAILPLAMASLFSWLWWGSLSKPWLYVALALIGLYILFGVIAVRVLSRIGIAGVQPGSQPAVDSASQSVVTLLVAGIIVGIMGLWGLKLALSK